MHQSTVVLAWSSAVRGSLVGKSYDKHAIRVKTRILLPVQCQCHERFAIGGTAQQCGQHPT